MKNLPMKATVDADTKTRSVAVTVEHGLAQSYSRSVIPRAKKEFKAWISENVMFGDLRMTSCDWDSLPVVDNRAFSIIHFTY